MKQEKRRGYRKKTEEETEEETEKVRESLPNFHVTRTTRRKVPVSRLLLLSSSPKWDIRTSVSQEVGTGQKDTDVEDTHKGHVAEVVVHVIAKVSGILKNSRSLEKKSGS